MTDKILIDRSVVEQALEAFKAWDARGRLRVMAALIAALEQPQVEQEPVAWMNANMDMSYIYGPYHEDDIPLYTHPQSPRQPHQSDPVAEADSMPGTDGFTMACFRAAEVPIGTKLYVHPQACRQSLGDDEIRAGLREAIEHVTQYERAAFIKGVKFAERAHGIGASRHGSRTTSEQGIRNNHA